jgi:hypothetical protein
MHIDVFDLLGSLAGGFLGAVFGPLIAFVFTGFAVLAGVLALLATGDTGVLDDFAFGAFFGPHISFAGGVAAAAYAGRRGYLTNGRDIVTPLVSLAKPDVLGVGALFGGLGYLIQQVALQIPWFGGHTDTVAFTAVVSAVIARYAFGRTGLVGHHRDGHRGRRRFIPDEHHVWLAYQQSPAIALLLGLGIGALSAWSSVALLARYPTATGVIYLGFAVSAISLLFLAFGVGVPATHHITLISAVAVNAFLPTVGADHQVSLLLIGATAGGFTGLLGETFSRFWLIRGDSHIDPPASSIWPMTTVVLALAAVTS